MLGIGHKFPQYSLTGVVANDAAKAFQKFDENSQKGKWRVVFFWPMDFTFVCPTEIAAFGNIEIQITIPIVVTKRETVPIFVVLGSLLNATGCANVGESAIAIV